MSKYTGSMDIPGYFGSDPIGDQMLEIRKLQAEGLIPSDACPECGSEVEDAGSELYKCPVCGLVY